jgi:hypothetical protein
VSTAPGDVAPVSTVRVHLPVHLRALAGVGHEVSVAVPGEVTVAKVVGGLEAEYPMLRGTIRDHDTLRRRPFVRYFACEQDLSHDPDDQPLPDAVARGDEPLLIVGAMAGG